MLARQNRSACRGDLGNTFVAYGSKIAGRRKNTLVYSPDLRQLYEGWVVLCSTGSGRLAI
jgi:hypothetical protein